MRIRRFLPEPQRVSIDIKPGGCPNALAVSPELNSNGVLSVAVLGDAELDVAGINPATVTLAGVSPVHWSMEDVSRPLPGGPADNCECDRLRADGFKDLVLKFNVADLEQMLNDNPPGAVRESVWFANFDIDRCSFDLADGDFHHARITIDFNQVGALITLSLDQTFTPISSHFFLGMDPYESRVAFGARTGGEWAHHDLDNINIQYLNQGTPGPATVQDFDTAGTPYTLTNLSGDPPILVPGGPTGTFLRLASQTPDNVNTVAFDLTAPGTYSQIIAEFDFRLTQDGGLRADGFGFVLLNTADFGAAGEGPELSEEPAPANSFGAGFDIFQNEGEPSNNHLSLHFGDHASGILPSIGLTVPLIFQGETGDGIRLRGQDCVRLVLRGDANRDNEINIADAIEILIQLFIEQGGDIDPDVLDANGDGRVDIGDAIWLLDMLF